MSFNLAPGVSLGEAVAVIEQVKQGIGLPAGIQTQFQGAAEAFRASLSSTLLLILAAIVTMYIVLGVLYESYTTRSPSSRRCPRPVSARCWRCC